MRLKQAATAASKGAQQVARRSGTHKAGAERDKAAGESPEERIGTTVSGPEAGGEGKASLADDARSEAGADSGAAEGPAAQATGDTDSHAPATIGGERPAAPGETSDTGEDEDADRAERLGEPEGYGQDEGAGAESAGAESAPSFPPAGDAAHLTSGPEAPAAREVLPQPVGQGTGRAVAAGLTGGLVVALLAAGGVWLGAQRGWFAPAAESGLAALDARLAAQEARLAGVERALARQAEAAGETQRHQEALAGEIAAARARAAELEDRLGALAPQSALDALEARLAALEARLSELELQPVAKSEIPADLAARMEARLSEMQAAVSAELSAEVARLRAELDERARALEDQTRSRLEDLSRAAESAGRREAEAQAREDLAAARAALARLKVALDTGQPFRDSLETLSGRGGLTIPPVLDALADSGAPTPAALAEGFAKAARPALVAATRAEVEAGKIDRWTAFLRIQLGARSLTPREGDDADAVLSRAEAALRRGDLAGALDELAALPPEGRALLADWEAQARSRLEALAAAEALGAELDARSGSN